MTKKTEMKLSYKMLKNFQVIRGKLMNFITVPKRFLTKDLNEAPPVTP